MWRTVNIAVQVLGPTSIIIYPPHINGSFLLRLLEAGRHSDQLGLVTRESGHGGLGLASAVSLLFTKLQSEGHILHVEVLKCIPYFL